MKAVLYSSLIAIAWMAVGTTTQAAPSAACVQKQQAIQTQLGYARQAGNQHQIAGLERALAANQAQCNHTSLATTGSAAQTVPSAACARKQQEIETQLSYARKAGNQYRIAGLERALAANQTYCSDASLEQERQEQIAKAEQKLAEREKDLAEAQAQGNPKKIARRQSKLREAQQDLQEALQPLPQ